MLHGLIWSSALLVLAPGSFAPESPGPLPIVGGTDATTCEWPSTVALRSFDNTFCSGTLIHPEVVLTAAHCIHPDNGWGTPTDMAFGEEGSLPAFTVEVQGCVMHPQYDHFAETHSPQDAYDLAYCVLSEPVLDVAPTPPLMGCEVEQLGPGGEVQIVGFGANVIEPTPDGFDLEGLGTKRYISQAVEQIDQFDQVYLLGNNAGSACPGDSGGTAYIQLEDGSWRVFAAAARIHPDAPEDPPWCLYGVIYTGIWNEMDWFESDSGYDLTPCHDPDGTWNPGAACTGFPLEPQADAVWGDGCAAQGRSGEGLSCAPEPPGGTGTTGDSGDSDETGSEAGQDTTAGEASTGGFEGGSSTGPGPIGGTTLPGGTADASTGDPGQDDPAAEGCGCRHTPRSASGALGLVLLMLGWRRRRW